MFSRLRRRHYLSLALYHSAVGGFHSSREAKSAYGPLSAHERRECKSRMMLLLRDADSGQIDHMAASGQRRALGSNGDVRSPVWASHRASGSVRIKS